MTQLNTRTIPTSPYAKLLGQSDHAYLGSGSRVPVYKRVPDVSKPDNTRRHLSNTKQTVQLNKHNASTKKPP